MSTAEPRQVTQRAALPAWPFQALFVGYPVWWLLGLGPFAVFGFGLVCLALLVRRGGVQLPRLWLWWLSFVLWGFASATMIDTAGRMAGFAQRWSSLIGATLLVVYVHNAPQHLPRRRVLAVLSVFLGWMTIGGFLGMAFPWARISTPVSAILPPTLAANSYVVELVRPRFAEVQTPWGATHAFVRPSAPFPYTNAWGQAFVLLLPVVAALAVHASRRTRWALAALVALSLAPALATLNRGIFVGVAVVAGYLGLRLARRASLAGVLTALVVAGAGGAVVRASGVLNRLGERTSTSSTTQDRAQIYREAFTRTLDSPWVGWGAPRPSLTLHVSVGTQGHFWYVLFSHGFVGLALFLAFVWGTALVTRRAAGLESVLLHSVPVCLSVTLLFYGVDGLHLVIAMTCASLLTRPEPPSLTWGLLPVRSSSPGAHLSMPTA